jgi:hypothetical protein
MCGLLNVGGTTEAVQQLAGDLGVVVAHAWSPLEFLLWSVAVAAPPKQKNTRLYELKQ